MSFLEKKMNSVYNKKYAQTTTTTDILTTTKTLKIKVDPVNIYVYFKINFSFNKFHFKEYFIKLIKVKIIIKK